MQTYLCASGQFKNIDGILFNVTISSVNAVNGSFAVNDVIEYLPKPFFCNPSAMIQPNQFKTLL